MSRKESAAERSAPDRPAGEYVLYWVQMNRRVEANHGLLYACELANFHSVPVLFYEGVTCAYEYANDRLHTFFLQGELGCESSCMVPMRCIPARHYAEYTIRPRINRLLPKYLNRADKPQVKKRFAGKIPAMHIRVNEADIPGSVAESEIDHSVPPSISFKASRREAERLLRFFLRNNPRTLRRGTE